MRNAHNTASATGEARMRHADVQKIDGMSRQEIEEVSYDELRGLMSYDEASEWVETWYGPQGIEIRTEGDAERIAFWEKMVAVAALIRTVEDPQLVSLGTVNLG